MEHHFQFVSKAVRDGYGFALLRGVISPKTPRYALHHIDAKLKLSYPRLSALWAVSCLVLV